MRDKIMIIMTAKSSQEKGVGVSSHNALRLCEGVFKLSKGVTVTIETLFGL